MAVKEQRGEAAFAQQLAVARRISYELDMRFLAGEEQHAEHVMLTHGHECKFCGQSWGCREDCAQRPGPVLHHGCPEQKANAQRIAQMLDRQARNLDSPYVSRHLDSKGRPVKVESRESRALTAAIESTVYKID